MLSTKLISLILGGFAASIERYAYVLTISNRIMQSHVDVNKYKVLVSFFFLHYLQQNVVTKSALTALSIVLHLFYFSFAGNV